MRWLFLFVLSINVIYIAWNLSRSDATNDVLYAAKVHVAKMSDKSIKLLSERKYLPVEEMAESQVKSIDAEQLDVVSNDDKAAVFDDAGEEMPAVEDVASIESPEPALVQENVCYTVGPFHELEKLRGFVQEIKTYVTSAEFRSLEEKELSVYWVYIKPEKSRKNARKLGEQLKAKKVKDFYIIRSGENNNGLSLGHFKNKYRANKLAKKVKKLGFDVVLEPVFKAYNVYWLDYQLIDGKEGGNDIPQTIFDKYIESENKDKISRLARACVVE